MPFGLTSPYEIGCDELQAWCPTWGFGRPFDLGKSTKALPEQSLALLLGLCTSAPAGPLSSYLATIQGNLPKNILGDAVNKLAEGVAAMWGKQGTEVFTNHHPLHASNEYNFLYHFTDVPEGVISNHCHQASTACWCSALFGLASAKGCVSSTQSFQGRS